MMSHYKHYKPAVLLACGPMTNRQCPYVQNVTLQLRAMGMHIGYGAVNIPKLHGCAGHPSAAEGETLLMAEQLAPIVRSLTGWA